MTDTENEEPRRYDVRLSEPAEAEIEAIVQDLEQNASPDFARRWQDGLLDKIASLEFFPHYQISEESEEFGQEVRRVLYRQGRIIFHVVFTLLDADGDGQTDTVRVLRVRNAVRGSE